MQRWRRVRGLLGSAITWGVVGALIGAVMFVAAYQPWTFRTPDWGRIVSRFGGFVAAGALWGSVCGLAFGLVLWIAGRNLRFQQMSSRHLTLWGAVGGAAFPLLLYTPIVLVRGAFGAIPLYASLTGVSAILGAVCGRAIYSLAKRAPESDAITAALTESRFADDAESVLVTPEKVR